MKELTGALKAQVEAAKAKLDETYQSKLDEYVSRVTNPTHLEKLLQEPNLKEAIDERESKRTQNQKYEQNKYDKENNTFSSMFKRNFDVDLTSASYDELASISEILSEKLASVKTLMNEKKSAKIAELKAQLAELEK